MRTEEHSSSWRNALTWSAAGFVVMAVYSLIASAVLQEGPVGPPAKAAPVIGIMLGALLAAAALIGVSYRRVPFTARRFGGFAILSGLAIALFLLARWLLADMVSLKTLGVSLFVPLVFGAVLVAIAIMGLLLTATAHARIGLLPPEQAELLREQGRVLPYSLVVVAAMGLTLAVLALAGPGASLAPGTALVAVAVLVAIQAALTFASWPRLDELSQTLSRETGNAAYYLILIVGGGWAMLAHLGYAPVPAPLDWLTMFVVIVLAASIIVTARRGLLETV